MLERALPALFLLTGAVGLVYQTVWMRMLVRVFGVTVHATTTVVALFLGGLAIGALLGGRARRPSLRAWGVLESAAALSAVVATSVLNSLPSFYGKVAADLTGIQLAAFRVVTAGLCLLPTTVLLGATLPMLVAAQRRATGNHVHSVSMLYAVNTAGAVIGVILVGFVGIATLGERGVTALAAAVQLVVGLVGVLAPRQAVLVQADTRVDEAHRDQVPSRPLAEGAVAGTQPRSKAFLIALSIVVGLGMLACEIAWTRMLVFLVGSSVYGFSCTLAMFLLGVALGSIASSRLSVPHVPVLLFILAVCVLVSVNVFLRLGLGADGREYLYSPLTAPADLVSFFVAAAFIVLPATAVSGALFPLLVRVAETNGEQPGPAVARVYAANTFGSVLGALVAGFFSMPHIGAQGTLYAVAVLFVASAIIAAVEAGEHRNKEAVIGLVASVAALLFVMPAEDVTREIVQKRVQAAFGMTVVKHVETIDTTVTVAREATGRPTLLLNGIVTSTKGASGEVMAHLPLALQEAPHSALVICFGVGSTFSAAAGHVEHVDAVELVGEVVASFPLFHPEHADLLDRNGVRVTVDDGRNFLLRSRERWDSIIVDGAPPVSSAGFANLYSREMFQSMNSHLTDSGVALVWIPTFSFAADIWGITRAFIEEFPHAAMWTSTMSGFMLVGSRAPLSYDRPTLERRLAARASAGRTPRWFDAGFLHERGRFLSRGELINRSAPHPPLTDDRPDTEYPLARMLRGELFVREAAQLLRESDERARGRAQDARHIGGAAPLDGDSQAN